MAQDEYAGWAGRYTLHYKEDPDVMALFKLLVQKYDIQRVLDCACGPGFESLMFHTMGCDVTGSDLSPAMLDLAREHFLEANVDIPLHQADYRELPDHFSEPFDAVICWSGAIFHMPNDDEALRAFQSMYEVLSPGGVLVLDQGITDRRWQDAFWASQDVVPLTTENERMIEHYGRVAYAFRAYSEGQKPWDKRGEMVIRYGLPDRVNSSRTLERVFLDTRAGKEALRPVWREQWTYLDEDISGNPLFTLFFQREMFSRRYDIMPYEVRTLTVDVGHPYFRTIHKIRKNPSQHIPRDLGFPLDFIYDTVAFRGTDGRTDLEIAYGVSIEDLFRLSDEIEGRDLKTGMVRYDEGWHPVARDSNLVQTDTLWEEIPEGQIITVQTLVAPSGSYQSALQVHDRIGYGFGVQRDSMKVQDFGVSGLKMSGIRLASDLVSSTIHLTDSRYESRALVPNPARTYALGEPVHFYVEIYDLEPNHDGERQYRIDIEIHEMEEDPSGHLIWRMLSKAEKLVRREDPQSVALMFEQTGRSETEIWSSAIETETLAPGVYSLRIVVTDFTTGETVAQECEFRMVDG